MHELGLGEFPLDSYNTDTVSDYEEGARLPNLTVIYLFFIFATLVLSIVLLNMLIGIMSEILAEEREQG